MSNSGFEWVVSPDLIADGLEKYGEDALMAIFGVASYWGAHIQNEARDSKAWDDKTGNARSGLFYAVDGFGYGTEVGFMKSIQVDSYKLKDGTTVNRGRSREMTVESGDANTLIITLGHSVYYGKFLELSNGGKHGVIVSTIESNLPMLEGLLRGVFA